MTSFQISVELGTGLDKMPRMNSLQKLDFGLIQSGSKRFPSIFDFSRSRSKERLEELLEELNDSTQTQLKAGKGPLTYEEAHRVYSNWRYQVDSAKGLPGNFARFRSPKHVNAIRSWTLALLKVGATPVEYLQQFTEQIARMQKQNSGYGNPCYAFADSTSRDVFLKLSSRKKKLAGAGHSPSNYEAPSGLDPAVREACSRVPEFPIKDWSDKDLLSIIDYARMVLDGSPIFVEHDYVRRAAEEVSKVLKEGSRG